MRFHVSEFIQTLLIPVEGLHCEVVVDANPAATGPGSVGLPGRLVICGSVEGSTEFRCLAEVENIPIQIGRRTVQVDCRAYSHILLQHGGNSAVEGDIVYY